MPASSFLRPALQGPPDVAHDASARRYRELLDALPLVVYDVQAEPPFAPLFVSAGVTALGYTFEEWMSGPDTWVRALHDDDRERVMAETAAALAAHRALELEYRIVAPDGGVRWVNDRGAFVTGADGSTVWRGIILDITARRAAENALRESEARVRGAVEASLDALFICRAERRDDGTVADFRLIDANRRAADLVHRPLEELIGARVTALFPGLVPRFRQVFTTGMPFESEVEVADGAIAAGWVRLQVVRVGDGIGVTARDVTAQKKTEETLRALALVDELTGVHNRRGFTALAEREWLRAQREGRGAVLAYIDLNDFKGINDRFGHAEGDAALQMVADVLRAAFRGADVIGRLGGDEFAVLVVPTGPAMAHPGEIHEVEARIADRLRYHLASSNESARAAGRGYDIRMSIGTASVVAVDGGSRDEQVSLTSLMLMADERLYQEKRHRKAA